MIDIGKKEYSKYNKYEEKMSGLKTLPKKVNENQRRPEEMVKYLKLMKHYKIDCDLSEFIHNKYYREDMMNKLDTNNIVTTKITKEKKVDDELDYELVSESDGEGIFEEEEIEEEIEADLDAEDEKDDEEIDDEHDNDVNVIKKSIAALDKEVPLIINDNE
jgi:hypothetical protein